MSFFFIALGIGLCRFRKRKMSLASKSNLRSLSEAARVNQSFLLVSRVDCNEFVIVTGTRVVPKAEIRRHVRSLANGTTRPILQESLFFGKSN
jgi:hypothetical protein